MNKKKKEQKRIKKGLLNAYEHSVIRDEKMIRNWRKNKKNKKELPFGYRKN